MASFSPSEHEIQQRIRLACGRGPVRLWRNNTGALVDQQGRFVRFNGLTQWLGWVWPFAALFYLLQRLSRQEPLAQGPNVESQP